MIPAPVNQNWLDTYPPRLRQGLAWLLAEGGLELYASGGVVRDWLSGRAANDLDLTLPRHALAWARRLAEHLQGSFVPLDEGEDVARVVWQEYVIDFSAFREGSRTIGEDLAKRDFTVNAMAIRLQLQDEIVRLGDTLLDPLGGRLDLAAKLLRPTSRTIFPSDPLRLLRAYRFMAQAGYIFTPELIELIGPALPRLAGVSVERINYELELILAPESAPTVLARMAGDGLWPWLFPELTGGTPTVSIAKSLATLGWLVKIQHDPNRYFPGSEEYVHDPPRRLWLRWACLLHGLTIPAFSTLALRLRWSRLNTRRIGAMIEHQRWPESVRHLAESADHLAVRALKLVKAVDAEWPGVFLLALAAVLAEQDSPLPPPWLTTLYLQVETIYRTRLRPLLASPPLLSGHDLQSCFQLEAGPLIGQLLLRLEEERLLHPGMTKAEAESRVGKILAAEMI